MIAADDGMHLYFTYTCSSGQSTATSGYDWLSYSIVISLFAILYESKNSNFDAPFNTDNQKFWLLLDIRNGNANKNNPLVRPTYVLLHIQISRYSQDIQNQKICDRERFLSRLAKKGRWTFVL